MIKHDLLILGSQNVKEADQNFLEIKFILSKSFIKIKELLLYTFSIIGVMLGLVPLLGIQMLKINYLYPLMMKLD